MEAVYFGFVTDIIINKSSDWSLSPNPASDYIVINSSGGRDPFSSIVIYDMLGKKMTTPLAIDLGNGSAVIDIRLLTSGIYFLEISSGEKMVRQNFIRE